MTSTQAVARALETAPEPVSPIARTPIAMGHRGITPTDMESAWRMATAIAKSGMAPKSYGSGENLTAAVFVAMQLGAEVGLSPMASVQNIAVINGKPGLYGPAQLALCEASGKVEKYDERIEGAADARKAVCTTKRVGRRARSYEFSVADAKRAGLWGKQGPWSQYPERMLMFRARSFLLRDVYPDVLLGLSWAAEELADIGPDNARDVTPGASAADAVTAALTAMPEAETTTIETVPAGAPSGNDGEAGGSEEREAPSAPPAEPETTREAAPLQPIAVPLLPRGKQADWVQWSNLVQDDIMDAPDLATIEEIRKANRTNLNKCAVANREAYNAIHATVTHRKEKLQS